MDMIFSNSSFDELLFNNEEKIGVEFSDQHDHRLRATLRKGNISLAVRVCSEGKRHYKKLATYPTTSTRAFKKEATKYIGLIAQEPSRLSSMTLNECFELLWVPYAKKNLKDIKNPPGRWKKHIEPTQLGRMKVTKIRVIDIEERLQQVSESGLKPATINKIHMLISKVFNLAIKHQICINNPCKGVKQRKENNTVKTVFTQKQCATFIKLANQDHSYFEKRALLLSLYTGMRIGEVIGLKFENISASYEYLDLLETKNGKSFRVFLNEPAKQLVQELKKASCNQFLFPSSKKENAPISYPRSTFIRIIKQMEGLDEKGTYSIHMLRRTFATLLQKETKDIYAVSRALNHSNVTVTQRYASIYDENMSHNVNTLTPIFGEI